MIEYFFPCPHCFEHISMLIDTSISQQTYIEDCEVCCNPIEINLTVIDGSISNFNATEIGQ